MEGQPAPPQRAKPALGDGRPVGRWIFLRMLGLGAVGVVWGSGLQGLADRILSPVAGRLSAILPVGRFRIYSVTGSLPDRAPSDYRLRVGGLVDRPLTLTLDDLQAMTAVTVVRDFQCVTGWRVRNVTWKGVRVRDLLEAAGARSAGGAVIVRSFDGRYTESLTLAQARRDDVLVAYQLEGRLLPREHGGPARLYAAPMYGYKSCKWLEAIEVVERVVPGYWEQRGYDLDGWLDGRDGR